MATLSIFPVPMRCIPLILCGAAALTACTKVVPENAISHGELMQNPLFAERFSEELIDAMVQIQLWEDPILQDEQKAALIEEARIGWFEITKEARAAKREGMLGTWQPIATDVRGMMLLTAQGNLYFDSQFTVTPGLELALYLTAAVDPRDTEFPDETAINLGKLQTPYGAQSYMLPEEAQDASLYRTAVLWDEALQRMHGIAQFN